MDDATTLPVSFPRAGATAPFAPLDHYWIGATPDGTVWSSRARSAVPASDPEYQAWLTAGYAPTAATTLADIDDTLRPYGLSISGVVRTATTYQLMSALTDAQWAAYPGAKPTDQRLFGARDTPWPEDNAKIGRIATVLGTTPAAWFDAALGAVTA